jgi:hypothetical protein
MYAIADRAPATGTKLKSAGWLAQAGRLYSRRWYELAFRYGQYDPTDLTATNQTKEMGGAFSDDYARHGLKWQHDAGQVEVQVGPGEPSVKTIEVRSQLQFVF